MIGVVLAIGGLASVSAIWLVGPLPQTQGEWELMVGIGRAVFWPCVFGGVGIIILAGIGLFIGDPQVYIRLRWFIFKVLLLTGVIPLLHIWARGRVQHFYEVVEEGRLEEAAAAWDGVGQAYLVGAIVLLIMAIFARRKPRMGQKGVVLPKKRGKEAAAAPRAS